MLPDDLPPWDVVNGQMRHRLEAGVFELTTQDLRVILRLLEGRSPQPIAAILDSRTLQSTPESVARAGFDGAKKKKASKMHIAVDPVGYLLGLHLTAASEQDRAQVQELATQIQQVTGGRMEAAFVDQAYTGEAAAEAAEQQGILLAVVKRLVPGQGFVLLPRRWVVERSQAWGGRFRRFAHDFQKRSKACIISCSLASSSNAY